MRAGDTCVLIVLAALLAGCGSSEMVHGGKLGPRAGVQLGWMQPVGSNPQDYGGSVIGGATLRMGADLSTPYGLEAGLAYTMLPGTDASVQLLCWRLRGLLDLKDPGGTCLHAGLSVIDQWAEEYGQKTGKFTGGAIDFGLVRFFGMAGQQCEVGLNYSILIGSENVVGTLDATAGINFVF